MTGFCTKIGDGICCLFKCTNRTIVGILGVVFLVISIALLALGGFTLASYDHFNDGFADHLYTLYPAISLLVAGAFFMIAAVLSCCAMCKDSKCLLTVLFLVIAIPLLVLFSGVVAVYNQKSVIKSAVKNATIEAIDRYENGTKEAADIDWIQKEFRCCGAISVEDYQQSKWWTTHPGEYPASCCSHQTSSSGQPIPCDGKPFTNPDDAFQDGCFTLIYGALETNQKMIAIGTAVAVLVLMLGLMSTLMLCCARPSREDIPYRVLVVE